MPRVMHRPPPTRRFRFAPCLTWGAALLLLAPIAFATPPSELPAWAQLLRNNPFEPAAPPAPRRVGPQPSVVLWGYVVDRGRFIFNLHESTSGRSAWVHIGQTSGPFRVRDFDAATGRLGVEFDGQVYELQVKVRSLPTSTVASKTEAAPRLGH